MGIKNAELKRRIITLSYKLKLSHIGSNLIMVDTLVDIYKKKKPEDMVILSNAHAHLAHLIVMDAMLSSNRLFQESDDWVMDIEKRIKDFGIHCDRKAGCDASGGSLGHGIGIALGMALADPRRRVYCTISDGECAEGSAWESLRIQKERYVENLNVYAIINGWGAYHEINPTKLSNQLEYMSWAIPVFCSLWQYPEWLQGQEAHYGVLDKARYDELMKLLR